MSQQIWTAQQAADYLEISKIAIEVAKSKSGEMSDEEYTKRYLLLMQKTIYRDWETDRKSVV